ncbi:MAG: DUF5110 domain-containing protein [Sphingomonas sp.]|nr:DUF5110 domain-containing protein [Sphingomonas sp.]
MTGIGIEPMQSRVSGYEKGARATYDLVWNDATKTLNVRARQGSFPGMTQRRELKLVLMNEAGKGGIEMLPATKSIFVHWQSHGGALLMKQLRAVASARNRLSARVTKSRRLPGVRRRTKASSR